MSESGVKNFDFVPWAWADSSEIEGTIAVDMPNYLARRLTVMRSRIQPNSERIPFQHVTVALSFIKATLASSILPIFVFDGPPETLKRRPNPELLIRVSGLYERFLRDADPYDEEIIEALSSSPAIYSYFAQAHVADIASAMGIPTVTAPSEAEMYAAALSRDGIVTSVISNDVDALLFGATHVTKQLVLSRKEIFRVRLDELIHLTELNLSQLRDLAIMCGCDFHKEGLKGIGPRRGISLLLRHNDLEGVLRARGLNRSERASFLRAREEFDEADLLQVVSSGLKINPPLTARLERLLRPVMGSQRAEEVASDVTHRWREFGHQQVSLEQWL